MSDREKEKIEWRKFYEIKDELWSLISRETTELDDSSSKLSRWICLTTDEELLKKIEDLIKKLNKQYKIAAKEKGDYKYTPVILRGVENIIINSYDSYSSYRIEKGTRISAIGVIRVSKISMLENFWRKDYNKNIKKYKRIENKENNNVYMEYEDLLELANARVIQARNLTGKRYTLNVRRVGEQLSKRYRYGIVIVDNENVIINYANKEAKRSHSLEISGERVKFPFPEDTPCDLFIKEKLE